MSDGTSSRIREKSLRFRVFMPSNFHSFRRAASSLLLFWLGIIDRLNLVIAARRKVICVAKRVQSVLSLGKGSPVIPSRTELFPLPGG